MTWTYNIDLEEQEKSKRPALVICVLLLLAVAFCVALGGTKAEYSLADEGSHIFVLSEDQDIQVGLTEPEWSVNKGLEQLPGSCLAKNPSVENQASDCYLRVNFRITDKEKGTIGKDDVMSETIDPTSSAEAKARCETILKTIWFDGGENLEENESYTTDALEAKESRKFNNVFNANDFEPQFKSSDLALNGWNDQMKAYSFVYKNEDTNNVFKEGATTTFFTHLVMPADFTDDDFNLAGDYYINVWVQAIQTSKNFSNREDAMDALSNSNVDNDMTYIDGEEVSDTSNHRRL